MYFKKDKIYKIRNKKAIYCGIGNNTTDHMFRDLSSGQMIFVSQEEINLVMKKEK